MGEQVTIVGTAIPDATTIRWDGPKPIRHFVFSLRQAKNERIQEMNLPQHSLVLFKTEHTADPADSAATADDVIPFARAMAERARRKDALPRKDAGPIDLDITGQCWVVLELAEDINWRFSSQQPAVTTKVAETPLAPGKTGLNADLRYVYDDEAHTVVADPAQGPAGVNCRIVYFRVVGRAEGKGQGMNFVVELYTVVENGVADKVIPLIIDPDVPNDGGTGFPSPP